MAVKRVIKGVKNFRTENVTGVRGSGCFKEKLASRVKGYNDIKENEDVQVNIFL